MIEDVNGGGVLLGDVKLAPVAGTPLIAEVFDRARVRGFEGFRKNEPAAADQLVCDDGIEICMDAK